MLSSMLSFVNMCLVIHKVTRWEGRTNLSIEVNANRIQKQLFFLFQTALYTSLSEYKINFSSTYPIRIFFCCKSLLTEFGYKKTEEAGCGSLIVTHKLIIIRFKLEKGVKSIQECFILTHKFYFVNLKPFWNVKNTY